MDANKGQATTQNNNMEALMNKERELYLREAIIQALTKCQGMRKRTIAWTIKANVMEIISLLYQMCDEGILEYKVHNDFAQMEHYEKYYVKG